MDNQKTNEGSGRNVGSEGSGSSMGKDLGRSGDNKQGGSSGGPDIAKATSDAHKTIDKAVDAAQPVAERFASTAHAGVDKVSDALTTASTSMEQKSKQLTEAYQHFAETGRDYVRSSPVTSVLVALAAGYTLSKLLNRRQ